MRKFIYSIKVVASVLVLTSCLDQLELEPAQEIREELALTSERNVQAVLTGAYDRMGNDFLYGGYLLMNSELLGAAGNCTWQGTFNDPREIFGKTILTVNSNVANHWRRAYEVINITNNILVDGLDKIEVQANRDRIEGEARFLRAYVYFDLVRYFSRPFTAGNVNAPESGVPLILTPTRAPIDDRFQLRRNTIQEIYTQVLQDLVIAEDKIPNSNGFFANRTAVRAILSRVYLSMERFEDARDAANRAIEQGNYGFVPEYEDIFNNSSSGGRTSNEDIFSMQVTAQDGFNSMVNFFGSVGVGARGDIAISPSFIAQYEDGDQRKDLYYQFDGQMWTGKWTNTVDANINLIRFSEMILTRAECNFRLNSSVGASPLDDINALRSVRGASEFAVIDLNTILLERELELAFEGHRLHDFKRTRRNIGTISFDANRLVYPIPFREIQANPNLTQNPGYGG